MLSKKYIPHLREALYKWKHNLYNETDLCKRYWLKRNIQTTTALLQQIDEFCTVNAANTCQIVYAENKGFANSCEKASWCPATNL